MIFVATELHFIVYKIDPLTIKSFGKVIKSKKCLVKMFSIYSIVGEEAGSLSANLDDNGKQHLCPSLQIVIPMSTLSETALH